MEAKDFRRIARENLSGNWWLSVGVAFIASLLGGLVVGASGGMNIELDEQFLHHIPQSVLSFLRVYASALSTLALAQFIIGGVIQLGYSRYLLKQHDKSEFQFNDLFSCFDHFGNGFLQHFLRNLYVFLWGLLFVIPGIVKSYAYAMTPFILADNPELTANEAITASKELMVGHKRELFWLDLTFIGWSLLSALTLGIGNLFLNPYLNASRAAFYKHLTKD